jgi:hypothetical protein
LEEDRQKCDAHQLDHPGVDLEALVGRMARIAKALPCPEHLQGNVGEGIEGQN